MTDATIYYLVPYLKWSGGITISNTSSEIKMSAQDSGISLHSFYSKVAGKYLAIRGNVQMYSPVDGLFEKFYLIDGPEPGKFFLKSAGLSDIDVKYLYISENNNIRVSDGAKVDQGQSDGLLWELENHGVDGKSKRKKIALKCSSNNLYINVVSGDWTYELQTSQTFYDSCVFTQYDHSLTRTQLKILRGFGNVFFKNSKQTQIDYPDSTLTRQDIEQYHRDGYIVCKGMIPAEIMNIARKKIQEGLDKGLDKLKAFHNDQVWTKEYRSCSEIMGILFNTPVFKSCEALLSIDGKNHPLIPPNECQIALRRYTATGKDFGVESPWHIDAYEKLTTARFGVIVVCSLSDWLEDDMGNYTVYPRSHIKVGKMLKEMSWNEFNKAHGKNDLGIPRVQIHANAGDVILTHPLLAHDVAPNRTDKVRWAVLFRPMYAEQSKLRSTLLEPSLD
jgi:hypothetical protein